VALDRALSKLGLASRTEARALITAGRVTVGGRIVTDPLHAVMPERAHIAIDDTPTTPVGVKRLIAFHKPRGTVTTRRDPDGRKTVFDVLGRVGDGLLAVGRLDYASTGLLLFTNDSQLAHRLTDPANAIVRRYVVTVRGRVSDEDARAMAAGVTVRLGGAPARVRASRLEIQKRSARETHLIVELTEGKNREIRRLFAAKGHEVTRLLRVSFGGIELGTLQPGRWRKEDIGELAISNSSIYKMSLPCRLSHVSASLQSGHTASTSLQNRLE
jgi:23S rRNA pseudouridine2605 synthase